MPIGRGYFLACAGLSQVIEELPAGEGADVVLCEVDMCKC